MINRSKQLHFRQTPAGTSNIPLQSSPAPSPQSTPERTEQRPLLFENDRPETLVDMEAGIASPPRFAAVNGLSSPVNSRSTPASPNTTVMPGHRKRKETTFTLPVISKDNARGAVTVAVKTIGYGGFTTLVPGAAAALLSTEKIAPQYISSAVQGGLAAAVALSAAIPEIQKFTEDRFVIFPSAKERWNETLSVLSQENPLRTAVLVGMRQKYKLAARQLGTLACTIGAGYFLGGNISNWGPTVGGMLVGLAGMSYYGESAQKQIWKNALEERPEIMNLSDLEASSDVKLHAKAAMDETERLSKENSVAQDIGSAICFLAAVGGSTVGCLFAARLLGDKKFPN